MSKSEYSIILLLLCGTFLIIVGFLMEFYNLQQFKKCYYKEFKGEYCEKYKNY